MVLYRSVGLHPICYGVLLVAMGFANRADAGLPGREQPNAKMGERCAPGVCSPVANVLRNAGTVGRRDRASRLQLDQVPVSQRRNSDRQRMFLRRRPVQFQSHLLGARNGMHLRNRARSTAHGHLRSRLHLRLRR